MAKICSEKKWYIIFILYIDGHDKRNKENLINNVFVKWKSASENNSEGNDYKTIKAIDFNNYTLMFYCFRNLLKVSKVKQFEIQRRFVIFVLIIRFLQAVGELKILKKGF